MHSLSKSRLMDYRQCPKRLWLQLHSPQLQVTDAAGSYRMGAGNEVGVLARHLFDVTGQGVLIESPAGDFAAAVTQTQQALAAGQPVFEAVLAPLGIHALADILLPETGGGWQMIEVKSAASVKAHYREDLAIQLFIAERFGLACNRLTLAHIDSKWVYPGEGDYSGLFKAVDVTADIRARVAAVPDWIADAQALIARDSAPVITTGAHCRSPHSCGFYTHCRSNEEVAEMPIEWLPGSLSRKARAFVNQHKPSDMRELPDELLNALQVRVKNATISGQPYFDSAATRAELAGYQMPAYFLDFETAQLVIPRWAGNRPYTQIPFQYSLHIRHQHGGEEHREFLDISGEDPARPFAENLVKDWTGLGPVFVYNRAFEAGRVKALAKRFNDLSEPLLAINKRMVDLLPMARKHYYHPSQQGSWSIKKLLPAIAPELDYSQLDGIQDGGMAMQAYSEATAASTSDERRLQIRRELLAYCKLDTYAMVRIWDVFRGQ
ncbi:MAG TPA: DUF2779 domain-containing protein [Cellvibrionaceae bacterium]